MEDDGRSYETDRSGRAVSRFRCESACEARVRRRCRSEDPDRSPYGSLHPELWPNPHCLILNDNFSIVKCPERKLPACPGVASERRRRTDEDRGVRGPFEPESRQSKCLPEYVNVQPKSGGRLSPYKLNCKLPSYLKNGDPMRWRDANVHVAEPVDNEEPRLFTVDEYQERYGGTLDAGPKPESRYFKTALKPIVVNARRSTSPNMFRKCNDRTLECLSNGDKYICDERRNVRAHSETKDIGCAINRYGFEPCRRNYCFRRRHVDYQKNGCCSQNSECNPKNSSHREGDWSVYENVPVSSTDKNSLKCNDKHAFPKNKQTSAKLKSRLLAIKAKKLLMETYSTGSDFSDDELSDNEDAASKVSLDRESDMSVEPADHHECLTSDSGPSISSVSDSSSLKGLSSALTSGVVVTPNEDFSSMLRPSMFPHVPPYLKFVSHDSNPLRPPSAVQRHLHWKMTTITPVVVRKTLINSGFKLMRSECATHGESVDWIGTWGKHMKSVCFKGLKESQKVNHFPGTFQIGRKDRLWKNLQKLMLKYGSREFGLMPKTYVLPHDMKALKYDWDKYAALNDKWIIKPPAAARGAGIRVVARWAQIPKRRPVVVQHYIARPYLINDSKFDMRLYVVVTSIHPLRIYLYPDGLARFASVKYSDENNSLQDRFMHLTNYSINRLSKTYTHNQDAGACQGHKWTLQTLMNYLKKERGVNTAALWNSMKDLVIKTILSGESSISCLTKANIGSRFNCYELFGIDVLLDENLKPWLLEVNISPSLHSASPLDLHVKGPLVSHLLNMAQFHVPSKVNMRELQKERSLGPVLHDKRLYTIHLSKDEKAKHTHFTELENRQDYLDDILTNLTADDVRHLIQAEDEFTQRGNLERIFPTPTSFKYLVYLAGPRYYNRLFDAWECKYSNNRKAGIKRLQELCEKGVHLEVPPIPAKNDDEESGEVSTPMQEENTAVSEEATKKDEEVQNSPVIHDCSLGGKHIVGEFCLICRPTVTLLMNEGQPLPVQQHA